LEQLIQRRSTPQSLAKMVLGTDQQILALIAVADEVRGSSKNVIKELHEIGIKKTIMLTGDNQATANTIGN
jgi:Cd2+/Zn2+-exporting ATPase